MNAKRSRRIHRLGAGTAATAAVLALTAGPAAASVRGGAYALSANVNALVAPVSLGALPAVSLPPEGGGPYGESLAATNVAGLAPVRAATVSTEGNASLGSARSSASVIDARIAGLVTVATASSSCAATAGGADGAATVTGLVVAGTPVSTVDAGPNTTIALPVGTVVLNEQQRVGGALTVNAVRVSLDAAALAGSVVVAQSRCAVSSPRAARAKAVRRARRSAGTR